MDPTTVFVVAIISATVTIVSLVLSIFGSAWLNQRNNERLFESFRSEIKAEFQSIRAEIKTLEAKIDALDARVSRIEHQLEQIFKPILK